MLKMYLETLELHVEEVVFLHAQEDVEHDADQLGDARHRVLAVRLDRLLHVQKINK